MSEKAKPNRSRCLWSKDCAKPRSEGSKYCTQHKAEFPAAVAISAEPVVEIQDRGWELAAYVGGEYVGGARRACVGGSRGQSWYWPVTVGSVQSEGRRKADARTELLRLATEAAKAGAR